MPLVGVDVAPMKAVCAQFPVRAECLTAAQENVEHGIWGGTGAKEGMHLRTAARKVAA